MDSLAAVTAGRQALARALDDDRGPEVDSDAAERLLLAFEELASNAVRHGGRPAAATVSCTPSGWLVDVSDTAIDQPPVPAGARDPGLGGLGLHMIARLAARHGWIVVTERKHVWAEISSTSG